MDVKRLEYLSELAKLRQTSLMSLIQELQTDVTWNVDYKLLLNREAGQPRGDCPYLYDLKFGRGCASVPALDLPYVTGNHPPL